VVRRGVYFGERIVKSRNRLRDYRRGRKSFYNNFKTAKNDDYLEACKNKNL
jgi:hypothetical protein